VAAIAEEPRVVGMPGDPPRINVDRLPVAAHVGRPEPEPEDGVGAVGVLDELRGRLGPEPGRILSGLAENSCSARRVTNVLDEYINLTTDDTAIYHPQRWDGAKLAHELTLRYHSGEANSHNKGA
jgi:hypothetical protein